MKSTWEYNSRTGSLKFPRGDTPQIKVSVTPPKNAVITLTFTMRKTADVNSPVLITRTLELASDGYYYMKFVESDTKTLDYGKYVYDIEYRDTTDAQNIKTKTVVYSTIELTKEVTIHV